ncbi:putative RfbQRSO155-1 [Shewanella benthica KT99]|uniref:Putative RfbQRSO155-1 n=1 Tax=Shewanella benthica KT99 TaxID=314608 RepID=A9D6W2_9GAMM|nr:putative RfbQRSO155-1 [Shewanella benthica KT99]
MKTNEITAIPELLAMLDIENSIITLDAMGCQKEIVKLIVKQKADYILALKGHHSGLQGELEAWWHKCQREGFTADNFDEHTTIDSGHGRIETRRCQQVLVNKSWLNNKYQWVGLKSIIKVTSIRRQLTWPVRDN